MYKCNFPGCNYTTEVKSQIHYHHIVPQSKNGSNKSYNLISVCPTHHTKIYIPGEEYGSHCKYGEDSIIMIRKLPSTVGEVLEYTRIHEEELCYERI